MARNCATSYFARKLKTRSRWTSSSCSARAGFTRSLRLTMPTTFRDMGSSITGKRSRPRAASRKEIVRHVSSLGDAVSAHFLAPKAHDEAAKDRNEHDGQ